MGKFEAYLLRSRSWVMESSTAIVLDCGVRRLVVEDREKDVGMVGLMIMQERMVLKNEKAQCLYRLSPPSSSLRAIILSSMFSCHKLHGSAIAGMANAIFERRYPGVPEGMLIKTKSSDVRNRKWNDSSRQSRRYAWLT